MLELPSVRVMYVVVVVFVLGLCAVSVHTQCTFQDGQCTYNINLSPNTCIGEYRAPEVPEGKKRGEDSKMVQMQQDFDIVKSDHENRIKELESSIQRVMRNFIPTDNTVYSGAPVKLEQKTRHARVEAIDKKPPPSSSENTDQFSSGGGGNLLLLQLQNQFNKLRTSLSSRTAELLDVKNKLNESIDLLTETQRQNFESSSKLVKLETTSAVLKKESSILKNKLKSKTEQLDYTQERLNNSETKLFKVENQLYDVVRSEALIKEELETLKIRYEQAIKELEEIRGNYTQLKRKHERTKTTLELREKELIECYNAKTMTFCDFEDPNICGFKQDHHNDSFDWERGKGRTPSANTGAEYDHTCRGRNGHFMYIEASGKSRNQNARLISPTYRGLSPQCLQFYYHMYGRHTGTLTMHTKLLTSDELRALWRVFGNQGNLWIKASVSISEDIARSGFQLIIEASTDKGYEGDISIDDLRITDGLCANDAQTLEITPAPMTEQEKQSVFDDQLAKYRRLMRQRLRERRQRTRSRT